VLLEIAEMEIKIQALAGGNHNHYFDGCLPGRRVNDTTVSNTVMEGL
jgi:hypothetical protein